MAAVSRLLWATAILGAIFAAVMVGAGIRALISAEQMAHTATTAVAIAIIPYVIARGWDEATRERAGAGRGMGGERREVGG
jgi:hypothetical protein